MQIIEQGKGEEVVRQIFPETTIVRPAPMFGFEDRLLNRLAGVTNLFTANHMQQRFWPVHVSVNDDQPRHVRPNLSRSSTLVPP